MKKPAVIIVIIAALIIGFAVFNKPKLASGEPIKIGFVGSLTGDLQTWGEEAKNSTALAVEEINAAGGIDGRLLEVVYEDGKCNAANAVGAAKKLIDVDGVKIIIPFCSQEAFSIAPVALENKIIELVSAATIPELTHINDYVFRASPSDKVAAQVLADTISLKYKKLAIITENNDYSKSLKTNFLTKYSGQVVFDESYDPGLRDFRSYVSKIKASGAEAILVNSNTTVAAGLIIKQMKDLGAALPSYGVYFGSDPEFIKVAGQAAEGFTYVEFVADTTAGPMKEFLENYKKRYGVEAPHPQFAALSYNAPYVLKTAIEKVGDDPEDLKVYFKNLKQVSGVLGTFEVKDGDLSGTIFKTKIIKDGKPVEVK